jgi:hypothetical protein
VQYPKRVALGVRADDVTSRPAPFQLRLGSETFLCQARYAAMKHNDIWYVTFGPDKESQPGGSAARSTRTFKSEVDAKLFAMQILAKGWSASAGTLNPHQPKQVVGPSQIEQWAAPGLGG